MIQKVVKNYIPELTGLRALAAFLVFIHHFSYIISAGCPIAVQHYLREFNIGLPVFFALAGFSIAYRYYDKFSLTTKWFRPYLINRMARIYPMYFLLTIVSFIYYYYYSGPKSIAGSSGHPIAVLLLNLTFIRGFFDDFKFTGVGQGWSLTINMCFYVFAPFIFFVIKKWKFSYSQPIAFTAFGVLLVLIFRNFNWYGFFGNFTYMMLYSFFGRCLELFGGVWVAIYIRKNGFGRTNNIKFTYIGIAGILACVYVLSRLPVLPGKEYSLQSAYGILTNNYFVGPSTLLFLFGLLTEETLVKKLLSTKLFNILGKSSYVLYLIHLGLINDQLHKAANYLNDRVFELYDKWGIDWVSPLQNDKVNLLLIFIVLNLIAVFLYRFIEEPLNQYIRVSYKGVAEKKVIVQ
ncbi:peptidoglycan/LPS O-acetylase OafA/YrhL [Mucilaginibacter gracilis]|uniref:Peptidoglycan/LPS O-acetylase OafA/YrhL n=1 Tax=Mucilaginibacter gracilis TaxID=423350 RepID=A0A495IZQ1_9SPHI|nr:acyltransferase [Mucilaginibacter gracilis]RKR82196.1 peptidoglycan/LPS O-acetylase OafA/YrhL [Mucilaginibacter gracilis]